MPSWRLLCPPQRRAKYTCCCVPFAFAQGRFYGFLCPLFLPAVPLAVLHCTARRLAADVCTAACRPHFGWALPLPNFAAPPATYIMLLCSLYCLFYLRTDVPCVISALFLLVEGNAIACHSDRVDEVIQKIGPNTILRKDIKCLDDTKWMNDEVRNAFSPRLPLSSL